MLGELQPDRFDHWVRQRRMIFWEGTAWIVLLALGGGALIGLVQRERLRVQRIKEFFASFSHEVKTSLASLRLQAEALKDDLGGQTSPILDRLIGDTVRLQVQLENSLFLASQDNLKLFVEAIDLESIVERMREQWPNLSISFQGKCTVNGDERALRTILSNLAQNAHVHGHATTIDIRARDVEDGKVEIRVRDNGRSFRGDISALGSLFNRPTHTSGSGLGLYICKILLAKMNGTIKLEPEDGGFVAILCLSGAAA